MSTGTMQRDNGLIDVVSNHDAATTADRLEKIINDKGLTLIARVNHATAAEKIGEQLRPTELFLFGNPKAGTPVMQNTQTVGLDLPQKILVWQDADGRVWLTYNDPAYIVERHAVTGFEQFIENSASALAGIVQAAAA